MNATSGHCQRDCADWRDKGGGVGWLHGSETNQLACSIIFTLLPKVIRPVAMMYTRCPINLQNADDHGLERGIDGMSCDGAERREIEWFVLTGRSDNNPSTIGCFLQIAPRDGRRILARSVKVEMVDKKSKRGGTDRRTTAGRESHEVKCFARKHDLTTQQAGDLIKRIGNDHNKLNAAAEKK